MRKWLLAAAAAAILAAPVMVPVSASADPMIIKFSHVVAPNTPKGQAALKFKELAEKYLPGKVTVEVYPNSQLFGDAKEMEALALGDVQFIATSLSKFGKYTHKTEVFDLPFMFKDMEAVDRFEQGKVGQSLLHAMENRNYLGLAYWHNGLSQMSANKPLIKPEDAKGLKFRIQQSDIIAASYAAVDANVQKLAFSEVYQALQVGTVNAQENTWSNIYSKKFYEVQSDFTESNGRVIDYMVLVNAKWWNGLPKDIQAGLSKAMKEATAVNNQIAEKLNADAKKKIMDSGKVKIHELTPAQHAAWVKAMHPVWAKFTDKIGKDIVDAAVASNNPKTN
ncbi:MAG: DctP family TRAP transporter solute-binding subunit [Rhodopseudomonas sp.]|nr:DctP family TRAP transporter solute-binding subunit [Rhodopseudomonas sp.]